MLTPTQLRLIAELLAAIHEHLTANKETRP
jgi:hypothetical protein